MKRKKTRVKSNQTLFQMNWKAKLQLICFVLMIFVSVIKVLPSVVSSSLRPRGTISGALHFNLFEYPRQDILRQGLLCA